MMDVMIGVGWRTRERKPDVLIVAEKQFTYRWEFLRNFVPMDSMLFLFLKKSNFNLFKVI